MTIFSGSHLNPCVTLGVFIAGEVRFPVALIYILMQIIGGIWIRSIGFLNFSQLCFQIKGIGGAGMLRLIVSQQAYKTCHGGATLLNEEIMIKWWQVIQKKV